MTTKACGAGMKQKPKTPYQRLLEDVLEFTRKVRFPHEKAMWVYPKARLSEGWNIYDLSERVQAADQLGYDVCLKVTDQGLVVFYRKKVPVPYQWKD